MRSIAAASIAGATLALTVAVAVAQEPAAPDPAPVTGGGLGDADPTSPAPRGDGGINAGGSGDGEGGGKDEDGEESGKGGGDKGGGDKKHRAPLRLKRADANPGKAWFKGRSAVFRFAIKGSRKRDVIVQVQRKGPDPRIVRRFRVKRMQPRKLHAIKWDGRVDGGRKYARQGRYKFKVRAERGPAAKARGAAGRPDAGFFKHKFPVRGRHSYGDGLGAGRNHRGLDVFARCGTPLQAARAGRVQFKAYQGKGAGHYVVIDGKGTGRDYVYMHLRRPSPLAEGQQVRTGEAIGAVGQSGNASGCHLHFELWGSPGWYEGGKFLDPVPPMRSWDRWS